MSVQSCLRCWSWLFDFGTSVKRPFPSRSNCPLRLSFNCTSLICILSYLEVADLRSGRFDLQFGSLWHCFGKIFTTCKDRSSTKKQFREYISHVTAHTVSHSEQIADRGSDFSSQPTTCPLFSLCHRIKATLTYAYML